LPATQDQTENSAESAMAFAGDEVVHEGVFVRLTELLWVKILLY
jgi:hypothetical protein